MNAVLLIYFILMPSHRWEFLLMNPTDSRARCEMESHLVEQMFKDEPGNMRVICVDDERAAI